MKVTSLNGQWELHDEPIEATGAQAVDITQIQDGWISQPVPGDIHQGLIAAGRIKEPLLGLNSFDCVWTEQRSWWFRRSFVTDPYWKESDAVELELNGLDANASIFLNGVLIGQHVNAFYPFRCDIKKYLSESSNNILLVRLTSGVEAVTTEQFTALGVPVGTEAANGRPERGDSRRVFVRKPQYSFGWDWSPRVATTAIAGDVTITAWSTACIRDISVTPAPVKRGVDLEITTLIDCWHFYSTTQGDIKITVTDEDGTPQVKTQTVFLRSGLNYITTTINLRDPRWWWPNGLGAQHRYTISAELTTASNRSTQKAHVLLDLKSLKYGLRTIQLNLGDITEGENRFAFVVNGKQIFSQGADWIPVDAMYARITADKYEHLVKEAASANFNMLRVWGGGLYEPDAFYEACDRHGILLWHDFMFACAPYPDHDPAFVDDVRKEAEYQTTRLRNHACMALWSGSNENNWGFDEWWHDKTHSGAQLYNNLLPSVVQAICPTIPYWNGSPYGGEHPNSADIGDRHHWFDCMMNPIMEKRITPEEYDKCNALFVSEYGYVGAPVRESVEHYLAGTPLDRNSHTWQHHTNTFEKATVEAGITKHYADADKINWDEYFLYSGLVQGLMYSHSLETFRSHPNCGGALFWMYADCWGEVGWTVIDYYLRRKIAWYFVKRALSPVRLVMREIDERVQVTLINDTASRIEDTLEYGCVALDGKTRYLRHKQINIAPQTRKVVASYKRDAVDPTQHLWVARLSNDTNSWPAILRVVDQRQLQSARPKLRWTIKKQKGNQWRVRIKTDCYAHAVHLHIPVQAIPADDYFDLLPQETREVTVTCDEKLTADNVSITSVLVY